MTTPVLWMHREDLLRVAAAFTSTPDQPQAVAINAVPLLAWLEAAHNRMDQQVRMAAIKRQHNDIRLARMNRRDDAAPPVNWPVDRPDLFLRDAQVLYGFLTATAEADPGIPDGLPLDGEGGQD